MITNNYPLTQEEFRNWLESKREDEIVGRQGWCHGCPIFKCLKDKNHDVTSVNGLTTYVSQKLLENPDWVVEFISKVDTASLPPGEMNTPITASQALEVLSEIA